MSKSKRSFSNGPAITRESLRMMSVAEKNMRKKNKWWKPARVKIKFVLAVFIFCFLASCFAAASSHDTISISIATEISIIVSLIVSYLGLRLNLKNQYRKKISICLMVINIISLLVSICELYYFSTKL